MDNKIRKIFDEIKNKLESNLPFIKSEIIELKKPSMMGNSGLYYNLETEKAGVAILFWDTGVFEITTDLILSEDGNVFFSSYVPLNHEGKRYSEDSVSLFIEKINELLALLKIVGIHNDSVS